MYDLPHRPLISKADSLFITISVVSAYFKRLCGTVPDGAGPKTLRICLLPCFTLHMKVRYVDHNEFYQKGLTYGF
jgi:hypothetical protein